MPTFGDVHLLNITDLKIWGNFFNAKIYKDFFRCKIYEDVLRINSKFTFLGPDSIVKLRIDNFSHCENCCCVQSGRAARVSRLTFPNILTRDLFTPWKMRFFWFCRHKFPEYQPFVFVLNQRLFKWRFSREKHILSKISEWNPRLKIFPWQI